MRRRPPRAGALALALAAPLLLPLEAAATSCDDLGGYFNSPFDNPLVEVPVDAHPAFWAYCDRSYDACVFVLEAPGEQTIPASVELGACEGDASTIARLVPAEPLLAGAGYDVECDTSIGYVRVRADDEPSVPPLELADVRVRREIEDGCCYDRSVTIHAELGGPSLAFFQEGGLIEIRYADRLYTVSTPPGEYGWSLPDTEDDITLTAVNAAGARGEAITVRHQDFKEDLVYIPCSVAAGGRGALGLWLVLPIAWLRRRRAGR